MCCLCVICLFDTCQSVSSQHGNEPLYPLVYSDIGGIWWSLPEPGFCSHIIWSVHGGTAFETTDKIWVGWHLSVAWTLFTPAEQNFNLLFYHLYPPVSFPPFCCVPRKVDPSFWPIYFMITISIVNLSLCIMLWKCCAFFGSNTLRLNCLDG